MRTFRSGILLLSAASLLALGACTAKKDDKPAAATGPAEATVNGAVISQGQVDLVIKQRSGGQPVPPEARKALIDNLVLQAVVAQEGAKQGLEKSPDFVNQMETVRQSALANAYIEDWIKKNPVTDEMLKAEYDRLKAASAGTEFKARHILVEKEADAKAIIATLKKTPAAFDKLAKEKSKDPGSKATGGDLGWFDTQRMVPEFGAAVSKLEKGKFTEEPVKTQFGYHVILLEDSRPIEPPPMESVKPQLSQQLQQQNIKKHVDALKAAAKIEIAAAASAPAATASAAAPAASK
ncbi:peptidylprolyl isomerase [Piscinibacter sp. HJYY11]|uniref:peptidylprolyl isomerase n=1 Tax=Piscinibacter sp. HJYY11 TaxID=2801333 RepID=UPI00191D10B6|nr:peptidylprolyl isomerase [Piscinibacter sp. HJYY11]MBL0730018.1 peptidylprolyl isomerase [Piscinibacter sp. HJYY11]